MRVDDLAEIVAEAKNAQYLWTKAALGGNDEVGFSGQYSNEGRAVVEAGIQEQQIAFSEALNEFGNEFVFRSG